jgi:hypothetical protein
MDPHLPADVEERPEGIGEIQAVLHCGLSPSAPGLALDETFGPDKLLLQNDEADHQPLPHHPTLLNERGDYFLEKAEGRAKNSQTAPSKLQPDPQKALGKHLKSVSRKYQNQGYIYTHKTPEEGRTPNLSRTQITENESTPVHRTRGKGRGLSTSLSADTPSGE